MKLKNSFKIVLQELKKVKPIIKAVSFKVKIAEKGFFEVDWAVELCDTVIVERVAKLCVKVDLNWQFEKSNENAKYGKYVKLFFSTQPEIVFISKYGILKKLEFK